MIVCKSKGGEEKLCAEHQNIFFCFWIRIEWLDKSIWMEIKIGVSQTDFSRERELISERKELSGAWGCCGPKLMTLAREWRGSKRGASIWRLLAPSISLQLNKWCSSIMHSRWAWSRKNLAPSSLSSALSRYLLTFQAISISSHYPFASATHT